MNSSGKSIKDRIQKKRFLRNKKSFIFLLILCLGVGFAFLSTQLNITGNTSVSGNKWSVYFTNVEITEGSVDATVEPTTTGTTTTSLEYTVLLDKPGDYYEFTVDAVNAGTIDAMIDSINLTSLDTDVAKYLNYTATYSYGVTLESNDILEKNSTETYKVRVEFKKNIEASDLSEEGINLNLTFGVNYVQSNINNKLTPFTQLVKSSALKDRNIDFTQISSDTNGKGLYILDSTKTDTYPIYYYRGEVDNNNALFGGYCWKIVRTTETGGTKLLYNGLPRTSYAQLERLDRNSYENVINDENYPFTFDETEKKWTNSNKSTSILTFTVKEDGNYNLNYKFETTAEEARGIDVTFYKNDVEIKEYYESMQSEDFISLNDLLTTDVIKIKYRYVDDHYGNFAFQLEKGTGNEIPVCTNQKGNETQLSIDGFNSNRNSLAYVGYMYGTVYSTAEDGVNTSHVYGNTFTYENGTYTLSDTRTGADENHHYTCFNTTGTCSSLSYVFYKSYYVRYITLTDGKSIEDALAEMRANTSNSNAKITIDSWFNNTFKTYFTNNSKNYNDYLEDTVWCSDRDISSTSGWNPNGGSLEEHLHYNAYERFIAGTPSLACSNKNDAFTVDDTTKGNGALDYPVGLLTADEMVLAGGAFQINNYYLNNGKEWWSMSPFAYDNDTNDNAGVFYVFFEGALYSFYGVTAGAPGVRPSISLKSDVKIATGGDGTSAKPYEFIVE